MGELKLERELTIVEAAREFKRSRSFIRRNIKSGAIPVIQFNGKPLKPYKMLYKDLRALFTVASLRSLKTEYVGKKLGRKPLKREVFLWPE